MAKVFDFDDTFKERFTEVISSVPKYLKWRCSSYDEDDEQDCCFMRAFLYVVLYDDDGSILRVYESLNCLECIENSVIDDIFAMCSMASFLLHEKIYSNIPEEEIFKAVQKMINRCKIDCDAYLTVTMQLDREKRMFHNYTFSNQKMSNIMDATSWRFDTFII